MKRQTENKQAQGWTDTRRGIDRQPDIRWADGQPDRRWADIQERRLTGEKMDTDRLEGGQTEGDCEG